jgi:hypothetical protein
LIDGGEKGSGGSDRSLPGPWSFEEEARGEHYCGYGQGMSEVRLPLLEDPLGGGAQVEELELAQVLDRRVPSIVRCDLGFDEQHAMLTLVFDKQEHVGFDVAGTPTGGVARERDSVDPVDQARAEAVGRYLLRSGPRISYSSSCSDPRFG